MLNFEINFNLYFFHILGQRFMPLTMLREVLSQKTPKMVTLSPRERGGVRSTPFNQEMGGNLFFEHNESNEELLRLKVYMCKCPYNNMK